jgi:predicted dienelactone hydrolase
MVAASDARFEAAVAMAPVVNETLETAVQHLRSPVLVMGGRLDDITPFPWQERLFTHLPSEIPRYLLTFPLGGHTAYSELCPPEAPGCRPGELAEGAHPLVKAYTVAFLRVYLLGDTRYSLLLNATVGGPDVEWASGKP